MINKAEYSRMVFAAIKKHVKGWVDVHFEDDDTLIVCIQHDKKFFKKHFPNILTYMSNGGTVEDLANMILDKYEIFIMNRYYLKESGLAPKRAHLAVSDPAGYTEPIVLGKGYVSEPVVLGTAPSSICGTGETEV